MFFKDLTQVEQHEEQERLRDRLASLGEMAAGIAHELKNPLAGIQVSVGLLRRKVGDSPEMQSLMADIISEAKLANAIVVELLEFVRPIRLQVDQTSLSAVLHRAIALTRPKTAASDVTMSVHVPDELPEIDADPSQLCQVFTNLLLNACEAMNGRGTVGITASVDRASGARHGGGETGVPSIIVDVADNGPGMPAELTDRIFTPFFTTKPEGSGLGLPIVSKIVNAHNGRIDVISSPAGTRFRITLPIQQTSHDAIAKD
jgi:signal transduction histidine kinase